MAAATGLALVAVVSGCSNGTGDTMDITPEASLVEMRELAERTQAAIGGTWEAADSPAPDRCSGGGEPRSQFFLARYGPEVTDPDELEATLRAVWEKADLVVERVERPPSNTEFTGTGPDGSSMLVLAGTERTLVQGLSPCFPETDWDLDKDYVNWDPDELYVTPPPVPPSPAP